jgi:hypothetical protein
MSGFEGWAPDDYCRNVSAGLAPMENKLLALDFGAHGFSWGRADKPHKYGWEVYDETSKDHHGFMISLKGNVRHTFASADLGPITAPDILERMRRFARAFRAPLTR